jgi:type II secretory pathway pseudopilin PulG
VLVVIGLLIGGILEAQSMISTAKIQAQIRQLQQFDAMVENFKTQYDFLPGDAPAFGGGGVGLVTWLNPNVVGFYDGRGLAGGIANFWNNIDSTQFPGTCPYANYGCTANTSGTNKNVPLAKFGKSNSYFIASAITDGIQSYTTNPLNYYAILDSNQVQSATCGGPTYCFVNTDARNSTVKPIDLLALDKKIDDGIANTGNVMSGHMGNGLMPASASNTICTNAAGTSYLTNNNYECTPLIRIGAQAGDPQ